MSTHLQIFHWKLIKRKKQLYSLYIYSLLYSLYNIYYILLKRIEHVGTIEQPDTCHGGYYIMRTVDELKPLHYKLYDILLPIIQNGLFLID